MTQRLSSYRILIFLTAFFPLPSVAIAVILTVFPFPAFFAFTIPLDDTVAYFLLLDFHLTDLLACPVTVTTAFSLIFFPAFTDFFPLIFMYMWILFFASTPIGLFNVLLYLLVIIAFCTFTIKTWLYYFRKRKQII